jgi:hypothetical protein
MTYRSDSLWRFRLLEEPASKDCDEVFMVMLLLLCWFSDERDERSRKKSDARWSACTHPKLFALL